MVTAVDADRFGRDIDLPLDPDSALPKTATGDLRLVEGYANLQRTVQRLAMTEPGSLIHRPDWGGGAPGYIERTSTPGPRAQLAARIRRAVLVDGRFSECSVTVEDGLASLGDKAGSHAGILVTIRALVQDDDEWITASAAVVE